MPERRPGGPVLTGPGADANARAVPPPARRNQPRAPAPAVAPRTRGVTGDGRRHHEAAAGGRCPLRAPDPALEPEDEALHLRRAQRHLHHRPAADAVLHRPRLRVRRARPSPHGGTVLFVGTKKQAQEADRRRGEPGAASAVRQRAAGWAACSPTSRPCTERVAAPEASSRRWTRRRASSDAPRRKSLKLTREREKLEKNLGGIKDMSEVPSAIFVIDTKKEHIAVTEARKLGHPGRRRSSTPTAIPTSSTTSIPGNDDAIRSAALLTKVIARAAADGLHGALRPQRRRRRQAARAWPPTSRSPSGSATCCPPAQARTARASPTPAPSTRPARRPRRPRSPPATAPARADAKGTKRQSTWRTSPPPKSRSSATSPAPG